MIKITSVYHYSIIAMISGALLIAATFALWSMYHHPVTSSPVAIQHTDEKLAPRGSLAAQEPTATQKNLLASTSSRAVGGSAAPQPGCNLYASIIAKPASGETTYTISVSSTGTETCSNVSYSVYYPAGEKYQSASPRPTASDYYWVLGTMKPEETRVTTITTIPADKTPLEMCATADNATADACAYAVVGDTATTVTVNTSTATPVEKTVKTAIDVVTTYSAPVGKEYGIWVWDSPLSMSSQKMDTIVSAAKTTGMNVIYLTIDDVLTTKDKVQFTKALATFVQKARDRGIAVDAVAGARDWAKPANRWKGYAAIDYVKEYNQSNPKLRGFQYDVEPYLLPEYEENKAPVLNDLVAFIDASATRLSGSSVRFAVVIPHFYDSTQAWTPKTTLNGVTDYTYTHLSRILDRNPDSTIIVMAYRNYFEGDGGTREIVTPEIEQAGSTKVIVAQETGNVEPDFVTFYGHTKNDLFAALTTIQTAFKNKAGFGGVAVHYFDPFVNLR